MEPNTETTVPAVATKYTAASGTITVPAVAKPDYSPEAVRKEYERRVNEAKAFVNVAIQRRKDANADVTKARAALADAQRVLAAMTPRIRTRKPKA